MATFRMTGLIAAALTPFRPDGSLHLEQIGPMVDFMLENQVDGLYICGSTGEGPSLTTAERQQVTEEFVRVVGGRVPVIVQVGHNSLADARELVAAAQRAGVDAISAICPSYFAIDSLATLVECASEIASAAPELPFYYYHIPGLTGHNFSMVEFLQEGKRSIPNLVGMKYTQPTLDEYQRCVALHEGHFNLLWGVDEMFLGALSMGAEGAVGSMYNLFAPLFQSIRSHWLDEEREIAQMLQLRGVELVATLRKYSFHAALKAIMCEVGIDCGTTRWPLRPLTLAERGQLVDDLNRLGLPREFLPVAT